MSATTFGILKRRTEQINMCRVMLTVLWILLCVCMFVLMSESKLFASLGNLHHSPSLLDKSRFGERFKRKLTIRFSGSVCSVDVLNAPRGPCTVSQHSDCVILGGEKNKKTKCTMCHPPSVFHDFIPSKMK